jgi:hypothetical protein
MMGTEMAVAVVAGLVALGSAAFALWGQIRTARLASDLQALRLTEQREYDTEQTVARYREPLASAAYDLQSRLWNILEQRVLETYYLEGDDRERAYTIDYTVFLVAQYFGWIEALRRDIQYIDLGADEETRRVARLQSRVHSLFQTDRLPKGFRVFAGEQRAIGELMLCDAPDGLACLGYAAFLDQLAQKDEALLNALRTDLCAIAQDLATARPRLIAIQHALIDLLAFLDPGFVRFPEEKRTKVAADG